MYVHTYIMYKDTYIIHTSHLHFSQNANTQFHTRCPKFLMTVRNPGIDSSTLTPNDNGKNSTSPYGLSLADTVNSAIVADESRTGQYQVT